jgi:hypothetical protein
VTKILTAAAAAFFAIAAFIGTGAEAAGFNVRLAAPAGFSTLEKAGCHGGGFRRIYRKRYQSARRHVKRKVQVARKPVEEKVTVAKAEPETKIETASPVVSENSSISTANGKVAEAKPVETAKPEKVAAVKEVGCKQFFPSVGMTLSVSCQ